jgi:hypothetical protein
MEGGYQEGYGGFSGYLDGRFDDRAREDFRDEEKRHAHRIKEYDSGDERNGEEEPKKKKKKKKREKGM